MEIFSIPKIIISSDRSSSGKTTVSIGLMGALVKLGYSVQPFKVALDYIDPQYHTEITGRDCRNLDGYLMTKQEIIYVFKHACQLKDNYNKEADIAIIEGVRGLYEGFDSITDTGSTSQIATILNCPILFVINAKSMTRSCAALIRGFLEFDKNIKIKGVILNNIGSQKHKNKAIKSIEYYTNIPVVGVIYRDNNIELNMRALGLKSIPEQYNDKEKHNLKIKYILKQIEDGVDINQIINIAKDSKQIFIDDSVNYKQTIFEQKDNYIKYKNVKIGIPYDQAFNFYYKDNLEIFKSYGVSLKKFSILHDIELPNDINALYIGSGNIEYFLKELEQNDSMRKSIKEVSKKGMPIYGESAGMSYLTEKIKIINKYGTFEEYKMVGALPGTTLISKNKLVVSYTEGSFIEDSIIGNKGDTFKAHEFHNTKLINLPKIIKYAIHIKRGFGIQNLNDGITVNNTVGTYVHFHAVSYQMWIKRLVDYALNYRNNQL